MTSVDPKQEALLDELLKDYTSPQDILGEHGLLKHLTKRLVERALDAELTAHLGYAPHVRHGSLEGNTRNGTGQKRVQTATGGSTSSCPATARAVSIRSWSRSDNGVWRALMKRS